MCFIYHQGIIHFIAWGLVHIMKHATSPQPQLSHIKYQFVFSENPTPLTLQV